MSKLTIKANPLAVINPRFSEYFVQIAEGMRQINDIKTVGVYECPSPEVTKEGEVIGYMAEFMLRTGRVMGVCWGGKFYFGDADLMDMYSDTYLDDEGSIMLSHDFGWSACTLCGKDIFRLGIDFGSKGHVHTGCCTKFVQFKATGRDVEDVSPYTENEDDKNDRGRVYLDKLVIESTDTWDNPTAKKEGKWCLQIENWSKQSDDLDDLEIELYKWAQSAGHCDNLGLVLSWNEWNSGGGCMIWSHEFMDGKSIHVTDECFILSSLGTHAHLDQEGSEELGGDYLLPPMYFDTKSDEVDWRKISFLLVPYVGQEIADLTARDIAFIVENWNQ